MFNTDINPAGAMVNISWENEVNAMDSDGLIPCVARPSAAIMYAC